VLLMVFFLSVGLLIDFKFLAEHWTALLLLLLAVIVAKTALNIGILALLREPWPHAFIAGVLLAQIGEFSLVLAGAAERGGIISSALGQMIVAVIAFSLLLAPLWLLTTRRLLRVVILGMTSLHDTLDAIKSRRLTAAGRGVLRGLRWGRDRLSKLRRVLPRAGGSAAAAMEDAAQDAEGARPRRRLKGDTLTPDRGRGVVEPPEPPEAPRHPPPGGSPDGTLAGSPADQAAPETPQEEEATQKRTGPPPEPPPPSPGDAPRYPSPEGTATPVPAEEEEAAEPPRPRPRTLLRRPITDSPTETPRFPPPSGPPPDPPPPDPPPKPKPE